MIHDDLERKEQLARIDRAQAETRKFAAEQNKLAAEAANLKVSRYLGPGAAVLAAAGAVIAATPVIMRWLGHGG